MDNLENLSNADLREKCSQYGLPNIPITDSSRSVLIRKLRASMSNSKASPKHGRRDTMHVMKELTKEILPVDNRAKSRSSARRTIAVTSKQEVEKIVIKSAIDDKVGMQQLPVPVKNSVPVAQMENHDENLLINMEKDVQNKNQDSLKRVEQLTTYSSSEMRDLRRPEPRMHKEFDVSTTSSGPEPFMHKEFDVPSTARYNVEKNVMNWRDTIAFDSKIRYLSKKQVYDVEEEPYETPYLSNFARKLERLKSSSVASLGGQESKTAQTGNAFSYKKKVQENLDDSPIKESLRQWVMSMDRKYNLRKYITLVSVFFLLVFLYVILFL